MGQVEVLNFLEEKRSEGDYSFFTIGEIRDALGISHVPVWQSVNRLYAWGHLDVKVEKSRGLFGIRRRFRLKDDCK